LAKILAPTLGEVYSRSLNLIKVFFSRAFLVSVMLHNQYDLIGLDDDDDD